MKFIYLYTIFLLAFVVSCDVKKRKLVYLIPDKYSGWVKITYNSPASNIEVINKGDDIYVLVIGDNPSDFRVKSHQLPGGPYEQEFFYYSEDTLYNSADRHSLQSSLGSYGEVERFYITPKAMTNEEFHKQNNIDSLEETYR